MKKTKYTVLVSARVANGEVYRRVWQDEDGNYFIKIDGETRKIKYDQHWFVED